LKLPHHVEPAIRPDGVAEQALQQRVQILAHQQFHAALGQQPRQIWRDHRNAVDDRILMLAGRAM